MALVRERTKPAERPPLAVEVSANFCGLRLWRGQRIRSPRSYSWISRRKTYEFRNPAVGGYEQSSLIGRFVLKSGPDIRRIRGSVGPRASSDVVKNKNILNCRESNAILLCQCTRIWELYLLSYSCCKIRILRRSETCICFRL
jgi:hypothetical protein